MPTSRATLAGCGLFAVLDDADLDQLAALAQVRRLRRGTPLFVQGDEARWLAVVGEGLLGVHLSGPAGEDLLLRLLGPGEVAGELALVDGYERSATVLAALDSVVCTVPAEPVRVLVNSRPVLALRLLDLMSTRVRQLTTTTADLVFLDLSRRVAKALLERQGPTRLTQRELAAQVGGSRQAVNAALGDLRARGWIAVDGSVTRVVDPAALRRYTEG